MNTSELTRALAKERVDHALALAQWSGMQAEFGNSELASSLSEDAARVGLSIIELLPEEEESFEVELELEDEEGETLTLDFELDDANLAEFESFFIAEGDEVGASVRLIPVGQAREVAPDADFEQAVRDAAAEQLGKSLPATKPALKDMGQGSLILILELDAQQADNYGQIDLPVEAMHDGDPGIQWEVEGIGWLDSGDILDYEVLEYVPKEDA
ncbi:hypothetical protein Q7C18_02635 [Nesterenkonia sp. CL21]|uniref:hypothetical protein n=1 Tax=Nesterenkonia sp. CL21 TaxID=3064894 RepID=UPI00287B576E|nr:hypothetical protein [Nesterenkonia sp. CL21]MDS2171585.1 hypothetical protein [Nesterenkonia sp. CL21]